MRSEQRLRGRKAQEHGRLRLCWYTSPCRNVPLIAWTLGTGRVQRRVAGGAVQVLDAGGRNAPRTPAWKGPIVPQ